MIKKKSKVLRLHWYVNECVSFVLEKNFEVTGGIQNEFQKHGRDRT